MYVGRYMWEVGVGLEGLETIIVKRVRRLEPDV